MTADMIEHADTALSLKAQLGGPQTVNNVYYSNLPEK